ncbi:MAG: septation protein SepH [Actinomycetota bacterium]|nr:septation protein SepH [Actinomycetota bacterium]MDQ3680938.1 septation protein SepH [Actinomycetota bacterium]
MDQLHFVGFTSDNEGLMLSHRDDATSGEYFVKVDEYLLAAIDQHEGEGDDDDDRREEARAQPAPPPTEPLPTPAPAPARTRPKPRSDLSPREIQARLRSGSSIAEVADEAGVNEDWVLRFADPIIAEQARVVEQAQRLTFTKPRVGPSSQPLRTSVRWNLADQGAMRDDEAFDAGWSAYNLQGAKWVVRLSFVAKRRRKLAEWEVDLREGELTARNRVATDLGYVEPGRRRTRAVTEFSLPSPPTPHPRRPRAKKKAKSAKAAKAAKAAKTGKAAKAVSKGAAAPPRVAAGARKAALGKALQKSVRQRPAKGTAGKKATQRVGARSTAKKVATRTPAKKAAKRSTTKKVAGKKAASKGPPVPFSDERTSHLARAPSPIRSTNRAVQTAVVPGSVPRPSSIPRPAKAPRPPEARRPSPVKPARSWADVAAAKQREPIPPEPVQVPPEPIPPEPVQVPEEVAPARAPRPPMVIMSTPETAADADEQLPHRRFAHLSGEDEGAVQPRAERAQSTPAVRVRDDLPSSQETEVDDEPSRWLRPRRRRG